MSGDPLTSSYKGTKLATEITPAAVWWNAEDYHQQYRELDSSKTVHDELLAIPAWIGVCNLLLTDLQWTTTLEATSALPTVSTGS